MSFCLLQRKHAESDLNLLVAVQIREFYISPVYFGHCRSMKTVAQMYKIREPRDHKLAGQRTAETEAIPDVVTNANIRT